MITAASIEAMTAFAQSNQTSSAWARANQARLKHDIVGPLQAVMAAVERVWGEDFHSGLSRERSPSGVRLHRDRMRLGAVSRTPAWLHAATAAWVPLDFGYDPENAPRIELRFAYGFWEMGFAFTPTGRPLMSQMAANLLPNQRVLEHLLHPLLGDIRFQWCVREHQRALTPAGHGIVNSYESYEAPDFFDGVTAWDRLISATTATAWDAMPKLSLDTLVANILPMVRRVYPLVILTTAVDSDTAVRAIENYLILLAKEHPAMLAKLPPKLPPKPRPSNIIAFPAARS
jgi:hypothetical protein